MTHYAWPTNYCVAVDLPFANRRTIGIMALVAVEVRHMISARTKAALAQKQVCYERLTDDEKSALQAERRATSLGGHRGNPLPTMMPRATTKPAATRAEADRPRYS